MEKENKSRLPKPSGLRAPRPISKRQNIGTVSALALETIPENPTVPTLKSTFAPRLDALKLRRRSKSLTDLHVVKRPVKIGATPATAAGTSGTSGISSGSSGRVGMKRPAAPTKEVVKPKIARQKIPDWDYKSRFNILNEKHVKLLSDHKDAAEKLASLSDINAKYEAVVAEKESLEQKYNELIDLRDRLTQIKEQNDNLHTQVTNLTAKNEELEKEKEDHLIQIKELQQIREMYFSLKPEHAKLLESHEKTTAENTAFLNENNSLKQNVIAKTEECDGLISVNTNLKEEIIKAEKLRRDLHNTIQLLKGNIRVFCRIRPPVTEAESENPQCRFTFIEDNMVEIQKALDAPGSSNKATESKMEFSFDRIFDPEAKQEDVFEELAQLVQSGLDGYNVCIFAYGQTGSGKTYTMQGLDTPKDLGLIPRTIDTIFQSIEDLKRTGWVYEVKVSFLEIYNENVLDLLKPNVNQHLEICYNEGKGTFVKNLTIEPVETAEKLKDLMNKAQGNRKVAATNFNERSSRSHAVTKIDLIGENKEADLRYNSSVSLVDLAGSESAKTSTNERLVETKNINKSLSALGNVMLALFNKEKHIPYRNSKLTYLLQSSLGGNSKTLMVVNISPFDHHFGESINSLRFAAKVKEVKTVVKRNKSKF